MNVTSTPHVHVKRDRAICKFWLSPLALADNHGFAGHEVARIERLIEEHRTKIAAAWNEHFNPIP